jgi:hypothetical protein
MEAIEDMIEFEGIKYPLKYIQMPFGKRAISIEELNDKLMKTDGSYVSEKTRMIDEEIFYFVEKKYFNLPEIEILAIINLEI